jgi:hypothetical protein
MVLTSTDTLSTANLDPHTPALYHANVEVCLLTRWCDTEIKSESDLLPPGAAPGTVPTDLEQATGLERLEILGKTQGIDIFDMKPLDASRVGKYR